MPTVKFLNKQRTKKSVYVASSYFLKMILSILCSLISTRAEALKVAMGPRVLDVLALINYGN